MAGAANRCVIPEHKFDPDQLTQLLIEDREKNPSHYSVVLVSEGAMMVGTNDIPNRNSGKDVYGHSLHGGIGEVVSDKIRDISAKYCNGRKINTIYQQLGYLVRGGDPDAIDSIVPMAYGNLALDLILKGIHGRLVVLRNGRYDNAPIDVVTSTNKVVDIKRYYNVERYRPHYKSFEFQPLFIMTGNS
jgi:6-phosphofructokinase 1